MQSTNPKVIITNYFLHEFSGSELVSFDLAKKFEDMGWDAMLVTRFLSPIFPSLIGEIDIPVYLSHSELLRDAEVDLIWCHHAPLLFDLMKMGVKAKKVVVSSLSHLPGIENPPLFIEEINGFFFQSRENMGARISPDFDRKERCLVIENFVKDSYFSYKGPTSRNSSPQKILCVSNHVPQELKDAFDLFWERGIRLDHVGEGNQVLVTPELLANYDVVITIGRTVQMSLAMGIPVFCYDLFGGPGYISVDNLEKASVHNFSGRCCQTKLEPSEIVDEVLRGYSHIVGQLAALKKIAHERFSIDRYIGMALNLISGTPDFEWKPSKYQNHFYFDSVFSHERALDASKHEVNVIDKIIKKDQEIAQKDQEIVQKDQELDVMRKEAVVLRSDVAGLLKDIDKLYRDLDDVHKNWQNSDLKVRRLAKAKKKYKVISLALAGILLLAITIFITVIFYR